MTSLTVCRVCLDVNTTTHVVVNSQLQEVFEKLTNIMLVAEDTRPATICYLCHAQLAKCRRFMLLAMQSEKLLTDNTCAGIGFPQEYLMLDRPAGNSYVVTPVEHVNLYNCDTEDIDKDVIKQEIIQKGAELDSSIKPDPIEPDDEDDSTAAMCPTSDSEDDVPLKSFKTTTKTVIKKRKYKKQSKVDASELHLSKEQQMRDLLSRCKSLNYIHSPYKCDMCYKGFVNAAAYHNHMGKHDESSGQYECDVCKMRYQTMRFLRTHVATAHSRLFRCNKCNHLSHTAHQAAEHDRWHDGQTYECQLCSLNFKKRTTYLTHIRKRHPTEHICNVCGERFVGRHGLLMHKSKTHRRQEIQEDPSEPAAARFCSACDIQFVTLDAWKRHILTSVKHTLTNRESKQCPICGERIADGVSVADHMKEHEKILRGTRPTASIHPARARIPCDQCGATFVDRSKQKAHVRRIHLGLRYNKNIVCEVCGKHFISNASLKYHHRTHTGERPYGCTACSKTFVDSNQLRIHTRTHTGEKPYSCDRCAKTFAQKPALNRHLRVHTGAKPYSCQYCSKSFSQSNSMKLHVKTVHLKIPPNRKNSKVKNETANAEKNGSDCLPSLEQ